MLSRRSVDRLKIWQLQLQGVIAAQEQRLENFERHILTTGTVPVQAAPFLASLDKAIAVCKNTVGQLERTSRLLSKLIESHALRVDDTSVSPPWVRVIFKW